MATYGAAILLFHVVVPTSIEPRKIYQLAPVVCLLVAAGLSARLIRARVDPGKRRLARVVDPGLAALAAIAFFASTFSLLPVYKPGFGPAVEALISRPDTRGAAILISSNPFTADAEAAIIAEWAERERRDGTYLVRGTKLLARPVDLSHGQIDYALVYDNPDELRRAMAAVPISYVILHTEPARRSYRHHAFLKATLAGHPEEWELIYRTSRSALGRSQEIEVYRCRKNLQGSTIHLSIDLSGKIGRSLGTDSSGPTK